MLVFVEKNQILLFEQGFSQLAKIVLGEAVIKDLELKNASEVELQLKNTVEQAKIVPGEIYIIFGQSVLFDKDLAFGGLDDKRVEIDQFLKFMPFEGVRSRTYHPGKNLKVVAINRDIYEAVTETLSKLGFDVVASAPWIMFPAEIVKGGFTLPTAKILMAKLDLIKELSFNYDELERRGEFEKKSSNPLINKRLLALMAVFGILFVVLGVIIYQQNQQNAGLQRKIQPANEAPPPAPQPPQNPILNTQTASPAAGVKLDTVTIQVLNASNQPGIAAKTKAILISAGFKNVTTGNLTSVTGDKVILEFKPEVPTAVREKVAAEILKIGSGTTSRDTATQSFDVVVTFTTGSISSGSGQIVITP